MRKRKAPAALRDFKEGHWHPAPRDRLAHRSSSRETERATKRCTTEHRAVPLVKAPLNFLSKLVFAINFHCRFAPEGPGVAQSHRIKAPLGRREGSVEPDSYSTARRLISMQAIESACLSLAEFRQRSGFADSCESPTRRRKDVADAIKTVFWAYSLQAKTGLRTAYALEQFFEPDAFGRSPSGERFRKNKWGGYLSGRREPRKVLPAVAAKIRDANVCLASPLWAALSPMPLTREELDALVLPLEPSIQSLVRRRGTSPRPPRFPGMEIDRRLADALERRGGLDALATTVILVRIAHVEGETAAAFAWGQRMLRIASQQTESLCEGGVATALLELLMERVAILARHDGELPRFPRGGLHHLQRVHAERISKKAGEATAP